MVVHFEFQSVIGSAKCVNGVVAPSPKVRTLPVIHSYIFPFLCVNDILIIMTLCVSTYTDPDLLPPVKKQRVAL